MGSGRALHQMSVDGQFPRWFQHLNHHGVPDRSMFFNVVASLLVVLLGGAVEIYTFSNVGYTGSFLPVLVGYYLLRQDKPKARRPFRLPEFMKYVALALALFYGIVWLYGGLVYSSWGTRRSTSTSAGSCCSRTCRSTGTAPGSKIPGSRESCGPAAVRHWARR
jgi:amino acid transporter